MSDYAQSLDAALAVLLDYFNVRHAGTSGGDIEQQLDRLLHPHGIMRRRVCLEGAWYKDAFGAMLGTFQDGTPVALIPHGMAGYCYVDPTSGKRVRVTGGNADSIQSDALCLYRALPLKPLGLRDLAVFSLRSLGVADYVMVVFVSVVATLIGLLPAWANQVIFDKVIPYGKPSLVLPVAVLLIGAVLSQTVIGLARSLVVARIGTKLNVQVQAAVMARVLLLPPRFFSEHQPGELANRATAVTSLTTLLVQAVFTTGLSSIFSLVYIVQIVGFAPQLTIPALVVLVANVLVTTVSTLANMRYDERQLETAAGLSGTLVSLLSGISKIKLAGAELRAFTRWATDYASVTKITYDRPFLLKASSVITTAVGLAGTILIYFLASATQVSVANYMAFNVAYGMLTGALMALAGVGTQIAAIRPTMRLVAPVLECQPEVREDDEPVEDITGSIELAGVSFRYHKDGPLVVDNLDLTVRAGDYVAIVGRTGCGKSTLVRLLLGFEVPEEGSIRYDGRDIAMLDVRSLRRHIGVVLQAGRLVPGGIFQNITLSAPHLTMDEAWEAAQMAGIAEDIRAMPMGMFTHISEGSGSISGGQRQRLLIARAIAPKPKLLIFDEATSALDNVTQRQVSDALAGLKCTRIVVAHRLSTIRNCDRILVLDGGRIVEEGDYDTLVAQGGMFAALVERQRLN